MTALTTLPNLAHQDELYDRLLSIQGETLVDSMRIYARLILLLMNHVGSETVIYQAMRLAADPAAEL